MNSPHRGLRTTLFAGVSVLALAVANPEIVKAADSPVVPVKAPALKAPPALGPIVTIFLEGGLMSVGGQKVSYYDPGFDVGRYIKAGHGYMGAAGIDYQFAGTPNHISFAFRYGQSGVGTQSRDFSSESSCFIFDFCESSALSSARHKEKFWTADFMAGRDIGIGANKAQVQLGFRIADLQANTHVRGGATESICESRAECLAFGGYDAYSQRSRFLGIGPRAAIEGSLMMQGPWSFEYAAGVALLYGNRKLSESGVDMFCPVFACFLGHFSNTDNSKGWVPNANLSLGLSYAVSPTLKFTAGYYIDYFWNALRTFDDDGDAKNVDRYYHGPFVRATGRFGDAPHAPIAVKAPRAAGPIVTMFLEGGLMGVGGSKVNYYNPAADESREIGARLGWTGAAGIDYKFAGSPNHVSFAFRYGQSGVGKHRGDRIFTESNCGINPESFCESTAASNVLHKEKYWTADFMAGRDIGLGGHQAQAKLGFRIADLRANTIVRGGSTESICESICIGGGQFEAFEQRSRFFGIGPRAAIQGSVPVQGPLSFEYDLGVAVLYGKRSLQGSGHDFGCFIFGCWLEPFSFGSSSKGWVPNANASLGVGFAVTPTFKVTTGYQIDYFWNALRTNDKNFNHTNVDRYYHGLFVRGTGQF